MNLGADLPLRDSALPPSIIAWWPLAPGWWLVLGGVALIGTACLLWWHWRRRTRLRRLALARLAALRNEYQTAPDPHRLAAALSMLCRQVLLVAPAGAHQPAVTGESLLAALDSLVPGQTFFTAGPGRALITAPYDPHARPDAEALLQGLERCFAALPPHAGSLDLRHA